MSDTNTIMGWVLGAGIVALGSGILFGTIIHSEDPETPGFAIEGVESGGGGAAEVPIATLLATADASKGEAVFAKCKACHTIDAGGATGIGPNIHGIMGKAIAGGSFAYSGALKEVGGNWTFENMDAWLASPKKFASGNKMSFPGLSKAEDRANILLYLNEQGSNLPLPEAPAAPAEGEVAAEGGDAADSGDKPALDAEQVAEDAVIDEAAAEAAAE